MRGAGAGGGGAGAARAAWRGNPWQGRCGAPAWPGHLAARPPSQLPGFLLHNFNPMLRAVVQPQLVDPNAPPLRPAEIW